MTDEEREELLRWAAEDVLGWEPCDQRRSHWHDPNDMEGDVRTRRHLMGWTGFGIAFDAAWERGVHLSLEPERRYDVAALTKSETGGHRMLADAYDEDPAIAAWLALRAALT